MNTPITQFVNPMYLEQFQPFLNPYGNNFGGHQNNSTQVAQPINPLSYYNSAPMIPTYFNLSQIFSQLQSTETNSVPVEKQVQEQENKGGDDKKETKDL